MVYKRLFNHGGKVVADMTGAQPKSSSMNAYKTHGLTTLKKVLSQIAFLKGKMEDISVSLR